MQDLIYWYVSHTEELGYFQRLGQRKKMFLGINISDFTDP
jgi:hypothetical protein